MAEIGRPVDVAMNSERPEKAVVRQLWVKKVAHHFDQLGTSGQRLYLTLCGAEGRDLELLVKKGIIKLTETGSLTAESADLVAAIENSPLAVTKLLKKFPGLKVHPNSYESLLHGHNPTRFPQGLQEDLCRSRVINLDLNSPLSAEKSECQIKFPLMEFVRKFSTIHFAAGSHEWSLLLTLHGEIPWSEVIWQFVANYLVRNFNDVPDFLTAAKNTLGAEIVETLQQGNVQLLAETEEYHQRLLLALVPKLIAEKVRDQRWSIDVDWSFSYGGEATAPMVTWAIDFSVADAGATPGQIYENNIAHILQEAAALDADGSKVQLM